MTDVHIINHTHWDREWFLTHEYTTAWVPELIDSLGDLARSNRDYEFLLDGQTLAVEDLFGIRPGYRSVVSELVSNGNLTIGPCYSQPDWRITSGELHVRNLLLGLGDAAELGDRPSVAWLVDTFGHISQTPQLLALAGIDAAYVWRGVPEMVPLFRWRGADGTELPTVDLFGGYRNLYGITKTRDIAVDRLVAEAEKLAPLYGELPVPLFDGYDLDTAPEDPATYYRGQRLPDHLSTHASSPRRYVDAVLPHVASAPLLDGELLSGKFGATFPGTLSARTYLKVLHHDAEHALHRRVEPLAVMTGRSQRDAELLEQANRTLLQNAVHDCICGVSVDPVHERMERSYRRLLEWADEYQTTATTELLSGFASGVYAVSTNAMRTASVVRTGEAAVEVRTGGIGVSSALRVSPLRQLDEPIAEFTWSNDHYEAVVDAAGIRLDAGTVLRLEARADHGDTYSSEPAELLGELAPLDAPVRVDESDLDASVALHYALELEELTATARVQVRFDDSPVIHIDIDLDSNGTGFRIDAHFDTGVRAPTAHVGMPFDVVERAHDDTDLLDELDPATAGILMGQRETGHITEFPFHDFVALTDGEATSAVLARGLRSYRSSADGRISITLRRSIEWLARTGLELREGDAGPAMYVPGARAERRVEHRLGFAVLRGDLDRSGLVAVNEGFQNPPLIAEVADGSTDGPRSTTLLTADLPCRALTALGDDAVARLYNPARHAHQAASPLALATLFGDRWGTAHAVGPKQIVTARIGPVPAPPVGSASVAVLTPIQNRVGPSRSQPDPAALAALEERITDLEAQLHEAADQLDGAIDVGRYRLQHRVYVLDRERHELLLSLELNRRRASTEGEVSIPDEPDGQIAEIGWALNELRVNRRIYDYVVQALDD